MASKNPPRIEASEKIKQAKRFKEEGNEFHKSQKLKQAIGKYHRALLQLKGVDTGSKMSGMGAFLSEADQESLGFTENITDETMQEMRKLSCDCYNNLAGTVLPSEYGKKNFQMNLFPPGIEPQSLA